MINERWWTFTQRVDTRQRERQEPGIRDAFELIWRCESQCRFCVFAQVGNFARCVAKVYWTYDSAGTNRTHDQRGIRQAIGRTDRHAVTRFQALGNQHCGDTV